MATRRNTTSVQGNGKAARLSVVALANAKGLPAEFLEGLGLHDLPEGGVGIPYYGMTGEDIVVKKRTALKAAEGSFWPQGRPLAAYGQWRLDAAAKAGFLILVEGESDCWALWYHGLPALGLPGANTAKTLLREHVEGIQTVYIHREPDNGGTAFVKAVAERLAAIGFEGKAFELRMPAGVKDPADLHAADPARFEALLEAAIQASTPIALSGNTQEQLAGQSGAERWEPPIPLAETPEAQPFPLDVLPAPLARFTEDVARAKNCPADYAAVPLLAVAGAAIGASRALEIKQGWCERPCLFAAVIGPPGSAKTPALKAVAAPVHAEQGRRLAHYRRQRTAWEENDKKGAPPRLDTVLVSDITLEKLASILQDNPRGVIIVRDELTAWVGGMDQYRAKGKGADRQAFLSIWAGEPIRVDRKGEQEPVYVPHPFVNVIGGLPPALLPRIRGEKGVWDGFLDRVLLAYPAPIPAKGEDWSCLDDDTARAWQDALAWLWALQPEATEDGEPRPRFVRLTTDARHAWERLTAQLAADQNRDDLPDPIKGHLAKFKGYAARLALIVHCLRLACGDVEGEDVNGESLDRAGRLVAYFCSHCLKVHAALGSDPEIEDAQRVLAWIEREKPTEFKRWQVHNDIKNQERFRRVEDLDRPLDRLSKHGYIRLRLDPLPPGRGRPADPVYDVNPLAWNHQENQVNQVNSIA